MPDPEKQTDEAKAASAGDTHNCDGEQDTHSTANDQSEEHMGERLDHAFQELNRGIDATTSFHSNSSVPPSSEDVELDSLRPTLARLKQLSDVIDDSEASGPAPAATPKDFGDSTPIAIGKYQVREVLGQGGQASAYLALDPDLKRHVVLKVYHAVVSEKQREQVLREGQLLVRVQSPFVAQCFGADRNGNAPYLVMEYIRGATLAAKYARERPAIEDALSIIRNVAAGLVAVHASGLIHRDIKPGNIIMGDDGKPRLVDFGLASQLASAELATISGTPRYMPPEQARGELETVDHRSDLFGLGAVLYHLLTGAAPFDADTAKVSLTRAKRGEVTPVDELRPGLDPAIADLCMRCLAPAPTNRPDSARELVAELDDLLAKPKRPRSLVIGGGFALAALVAVLLMIWSPWSKPDTPDALTNNPASDAGKTNGANAPGANGDAQASGNDSGRFQSAERHPEDQRQLRRDFTLEVEVEGARREDGVAILREGDVIAIRLKANRECYVGVWSVEADTVVQLFPNEDEADGKLLANRSRVVPGTGSGEDTRIRVTPSSGDEFIHVVASTTPLPKVKGQSYGPYVVLTNEEERGGWSSSLRGLVLESSASSTSAASKTAVSEFILPYRVVAE